MTCDECENRWLELLGGDLDEQAAENTRKHLADCSKCGPVFAELEATHRMLESMPLEEPPAHVDARVLGAARAKAAGEVVPQAVRVARTEEPTSLWTRLAAKWATVFSGPQVAMATVMVLVVSIGVWYLPLARHAGTAATGDSVIAPDDEMEPRPASAPTMKAAPSPAAAAPAEQAEYRRDELDRSQELAKSRKNVDALEANHGAGDLGAAKDDAFAEASGPATESKGKVARRAKAPSGARGYADSDEALMAVEEGSADGRSIAGAGSSNGMLGGGGAQGIGSTATREAEVAQNAAPSSPGATMPSKAQPAPASDAPSAGKKESQTPVSPVSLHASARAQAARGDCAQAVRTYEQLVTSYPSYSGQTAALTEQAACYRKLGQTEIAMRIEERASKKTVMRRAATKPAERPAASAIESE